MNNESLAAAKEQCQAAARYFTQMQHAHGDVTDEQLGFNHAVLLALKALYEAIESEKP